MIEVELVDTDPTQDNTTTDINAAYVSPDINQSINIDPSINMDVTNLMVDNIVVNSAQIVHNLEQGCILLI